MQNLSAPIPASLKAADERLHAYGRWAMYRPPTRRCGSAEGHYVPERGEEAMEARREPRETLIGPDEAAICQAALAMVRPSWRVVLAVLYVPRRTLSKAGHWKTLKAEEQLRLLRIPPKLCQQRHLDGLKEFGGYLHLAEIQHKLKGCV